MVKNDEHQFESDIEAVMTGELGWQKATERAVLARGQGRAGRTAADAGELLSAFDFGWGKVYTSQ